MFVLESLARDRLKSFHCLPGVVDWRQNHAAGDVSDAVQTRAPTESFVVVHGIHPSGSV
jgi:hypothetical protein